VSFLGWYDPDKSVPVKVKLDDARRRYKQKFRREATCCLTSPQDAQELAIRNADKDPDMVVHARGYIARHTFYVGEDCSR
jgi:hypothetical protein